MIISDRNQINNSLPLVMTSIGGSPLHEGHTRIITNCKKTAFLDYFQDRTYFNHWCNLLIIVNCDNFLWRKHQYVFQNENSRAEILDSIKDVDYTFIHHSGKQTVDDAIHYFQPDYFCKGGDRSGPQFMPRSEIDACNVYGTKILYGVGGIEKIASSSDLLDKWEKRTKLKDHEII